MKRQTTRRPPTTRRSPAHRPVPIAARLPQLEELPDHSTARSLRQESIARMQGNQGNQAVQRALQTRPAPAGVVQRGFWDVVEDVGDAVGGAVDAGTEFVGDVAEGVADTAGDVVDTVTDAAGDVGEFVGDAAGGVAEAVGEGAGWVGEQAGRVGSAIGRGAQAVGSAVGRGVDWVGEQVGQVGSAIGRGARAVGGAVRRGAGRIGSLIGRGARAVGRGARRVGSLIGRGARAVGGAVRQGVDWLGDQIRRVATVAGGILVPVVRWIGSTLGEAGRALIETITNLPARFGRVVATVVNGLRGSASFIPWAIHALATGGLAGLGQYLYDRALAGGTWALTLIAQIFELLGGTDTLQFLLRILNNATPLTAAEIAAADHIFGRGSIDYSNVRIAQGAVLDFIFSLNEGRAFTAWDTINMPSSGDHSRSNMSIVMHELMHVRQYQAVGTVYMGQAIHAQMTVGYGYGGGEGLRQAREEGRRFSSFNREQQGQIVQDYHVLHSAGRDTAAWDPFIQDLRNGSL